MIVVILAAGIGQRLRPLTEKNPKSLLEINNMSLLERFIKEFTKNDVKKFMIVVGHCKEKVEEAISTLKEKYNIIIKVVENEKYDVTNTSCSTYIASKNIKEDFILINGDNVLDPKIIKKIIKSENTGMIIDNYKQLNEESFKIIIKNEKITEIGKELDIEKSSGEFIGVSKVIKKDLEDFNNILHDLIKKDPQNYYDFAYKYLSELTKIDFIFTNGLKWTEIDDFSDWEEAKKIISEFNSKKKI